MQIVTEVGIRYGADDRVWRYAGTCQDCERFEVYGGFESYCNYCV